MTWDHLPPVQRDLGAAGLRIVHCTAVDLYLVLTGDPNTHRQAVMQMEKVTLGPLRQNLPAAITEGNREEIVAIGAKGTQYHHTVKHPSGDSYFRYASTSATHEAT